MTLQQLQERGSESQSAEYLYSSPSLVALIFFEYGKRVASRRQSTTALGKAELDSGISQRVGKEGERLLSKRTSQGAELDGRPLDGLPGGERLELGDGRKQVRSVHRVFARWVEVG